MKRRHETEAESERVRIYNNLRTLDLAAPRVGVDVGTENFTTVVGVGALGRFMIARDMSLEEYGRPGMSLYDYAAAVSIMVRSHPEIFAPGRGLCVENQISFDRRHPTAANPNMPIVAGALIAAACSVGMTYCPVFTDSMYTLYYGKSRGSNAANKRMTMTYVPKVLFPDEQAIIDAALDRKRASVAERGRDPSKVVSHHLLDAATMQWYAYDTRSGTNTYDAREDAIGS